MFASRYAGMPPGGPVRRAGILSPAVWSGAPETRAAAPAAYRRGAPLPADAAWRRLAPEAGVVQAHYGPAAMQRAEELDAADPDHRPAPSVLGTMRSVYDGIETRRHPVTGEPYKVVVRPDGSEWAVDSVLDAASMARPADHEVAPSPLAYQRQTPAPSQEQLQASEAKVREIVEELQASGYRLTVANLEYFLQGTGTTRHFDPSTFRAQPAVADAELKLRSHFENWLAGGYGEWPDGVRLQQALANLEDGQSVTMPSGWDAAFNTGSFDLLDDFTGAVGASHLHGDGDITFTRRGDIIDVTGDVLTTWADPYDWNAADVVWLPDLERVPQALFATLQDHGSARPFMMESQWRQRLKALLARQFGQKWKLAPLSVEWIDEPVTAPR